MIRPGFFQLAPHRLFYGFSGGDNSFDINEAGTKKLAFMDATSASITANYQEFNLMCRETALSILAQVVQPRRFYH